MRSNWLLSTLLLPALVSAQAPAKRRKPVTSSSPTPSSPSAHQAPGPSSAAPLSPAPADTSAPDEAASGTVTPTALATEHKTTLRLAPDGAVLAMLDSTARVTTIARDRGWVRVQVEGWVRATDLGPVNNTVLTAISAADLRAEPDKFRGQTVRWQVQKIAVLTADPLRRDMAPDEPYILARGPGTENSILYLALPPSLVDQARRIDPLAAIIVIARVRAGRSEPSGVPLLDVESIVQR